MNNGIKHGGKGTRLYGIWCAMKSRCNNQNLKWYPNYGGRGITVCKEWADSFGDFRNWALANGYRDDLSIDRIDNDGPYCPDNCRWVTRKVQQNNLRCNHVITHNGENHTLAQWGELTGLDPRTLQKRLKRGWSVERTLTTRSQRQRTKK